MSHLKLNTTTVEHCLSHINEFYDAVSVKGHYHGLSLKKQHARKALDHLAVLLNANRDDSIGCPDCGDDQR